MSVQHYLAPVWQVGLQQFQTAVWSVSTQHHQTSASAELEDQNTTHVRGVLISVVHKEPNFQDPVPARGLVE